MEKELELNQMNSKMLEKAKKLGFTDKIIAKISGKTEDEIRKLREKFGIKANFKLNATTLNSIISFGKTAMYYPATVIFCTASKP